METVHDETINTHIHTQVWYRWNQVRGCVSQSSVCPLWYYAHYLRHCRWDSGKDACLCFALAFPTQCLLALCRLCSVYSFLGLMQVTAPFLHVLGCTGCTQRAPQCLNVYTVCNILNATTQILMSFLLVLATMWHLKLFFFSLLNSNIYL